jgi:biopolymer transport protein ExbD
MALGQLPEADLDGSEEAIFAEINITPLTDVFLVMLIIFMVSSSAVIQEEQKRRQEVEETTVAEARAGFKLDLPSSSAQQIDPTKKSVVIDISKSGEIAITDAEKSVNVTTDQLAGAFKAAFDVSPQTQLVIRADKGVEHGRVVSVMELAKEAGLNRMAIQTRGN